MKSIAKKIPQVNSVNSEVEKLSKELEHLGHDINNKVSVIFGLSKILMREISNNPKAKKILEKLVVTSQEIVDICKLTMNKEAEVMVDIKREVSRHAANFSHSSTMSVEIHATARPIRKIKKIKFDALVINLLKNSHEAGASQAFIEIRENYLNFRDNGGGMPYDVMYQLRSKKGITTKKDGHGIGLISVMKFCESHNWKIEFENAKHIISKNGKPELGLLIKIKMSK